MNVFGGLSSQFVQQQLRSLAVICAKEAPKRQADAVPGDKVVLGNSESVCNVDGELQGLFVKDFTQSVPGVGIVGEEDDLRIPCNIPGHDVYVTVDSLDGTTNYLQGRQNGVAFVVSLVADERVKAAYIVDVFTGEVVGYGPHDMTVRQWQDFDLEAPGKNLHDVDRSLQLTEQPVVLRSELSKYSPEFVRLLSASSGVFGDHTRMNGSIGLTFAHLFSGRAGAVALRCSPHSKTTPWDNIPPIGGCERLGFSSLRLNADRDGLERYFPVLPRHVSRRQHESIVVHNSHVPELLRRASTVLRRA